MKFFLKIVPFLILSTLALASPNKPDQCPSFESIKEGGLAYHYQDANKAMHVISQIQYYDTPQIWVFAVAIPIADAADDIAAFAKAKIVLHSLSGTPEPKLIDETHWVCEYNNSLNYQTKATTPIIFQGLIG